MVARAVGAPFVIGVDLGGTSTRAALVDRDGTIHARHEFETPETSEEDVLAALDSAVEQLLDDRVVAIGYGIPSNLERGTRRILRATNLPLDEVDLVAHASARFGRPGRHRERRERRRARRVEARGGPGRLEPPDADARNRRRRRARARRTAVSRAGPSSVTSCSGPAGRPARGTATGTGTSSRSSPARRRIGLRSSSTGRGATRGCSSPGHARARRRRRRSSRRSPRSSGPRSARSRTSSIPRSSSSAAASARPRASCCSGRHRRPHARKRSSRRIETLRVVPAELGGEAGLVGAGLVAFEALGEAG